MGPVTLTALVSAASLGWELYNKVTRENPGTTLQELRTRIDAADDLIKQNFDLITELGNELAEQQQQSDALRKRLASQQKHLMALYGLTIGAVAAVAVIAVYALNP